jgi:protoheme ferro-lyase
VPDVARTAVVLMNLGGPDRLEAVQPFLFNLFSDPAILRLPALVRLPLARIIAWRRSRVAQEIYRRLGGGSPLLANTEAQARALEAVLGPQHRCFVAMRYWDPTSEQTAREVADGGRTRLFACRSIRNSRPRQRPRRSPLGEVRRPSGELSPRRGLCAAIRPIRGLSKR